MSVDNDNLRQTVIDVIEQCVATDPANRSEDGSPYFDAPLVGFSSLNDPLFTKYKTIIGTFHWTPAEVLGQLPDGAGQVHGTVISWILPITETTRVSNRSESRFPSREWARTRHFGEEFNDSLRREVVQLITDHGGRAAAPMLLHQWSRVDDPEIGLASRWSERHAAYAAGLGTFSINDGFITPRGIAHRVGSVVTDIPFEPSPRRVGDYRENCLMCRGIKCGVCVERCPAGCISEKGHDKAACREYTYSARFESIGRKHGVTEVGCGLCQTDVPCEDKIPERTNSNRS